uniref:Structural maintenance of chromosomes protein n=1 Tax=Ganoderma boninense TaxID=34458 RepID=A0A5K1K860_9APHY|nr:Structural maintenance of chromosomes protein [Ganoderma boninense]
MATSYSMPIPNTSEAPKFDGHYVSDFLEDIDMHLKCVNIKDEDIKVNWILRYCTPAVRNRIRFLPEIDRDTTGRTWDKAKAALIELYGDIDKPKPLPLAEFLKRVQELADKPAYTTKAQVNAFYTEYTSLAQPLLKSGMISDSDFKFHFIQAIPSTMKPAIRVLIPKTNLSRANAPEAKDVLVHLRSLADKDDPTYESWRYDEGKAEEILLAESQTSPSQPVSSGTPAAKSPSADDRMDELIKQMENLTLMFAQGQRPAAPPVNPAPGQPQQQRPSRCAMCGQAPPTHVLGFRSCPELSNLVNEGRIRLDPISNRYVMAADGSELPRAPYNYAGGMAAYIRFLTPTPPATRVAGAAPAAVIFPDGSTFATLTSSHIAGSDPKLRSGKEYDASGRYDPKRRPDDKPSARQRAQPQPQPSSSSNPLRVPPVNSSGPSAPQAPVKPPAPSTGPAGPSTPMQTPAAPPAPTVPAAPPQLSSAAPPVPPINREEGWKQSLPKNKGKERESDPDVIMKDTAPKPRDKDKSPPSSGYRNMSELEGSVDVQGVYDTIMAQTSISLPLRDLFGISPGLLDRIHEATRRKRVPKEARTQAAEVSFVDSDGVPIVIAVPAAASPLRGATLVGTDNDDDHDQQIADAFFAGQGSPSVRDRFLAMSVGVLSGMINGNPFNLMINSGSELNLGDNSVPDSARLPLDYLGSSWSLRGIHGGPEQLLRYLSNAPILIGDHEFPDHLFISPNESIGETFSIILGQPFLTHYSARLDYSPSGRAMLYLWTRLNKERGARPTIGIAITSLNDPRNREIPSRTASYVSPYIEEISDDDLTAQVFPVRALAASEPASTLFAL